MTDEQALEILQQDHPKNKDEFFRALAYAAVKFHERCWKVYNPETFSDSYSLSQGMKVHLGIRYSDGSRGRVDGKVAYDVRHKWKLEIDSSSKNIYTHDAVIEKWMPYPDYPNDN